MNPETEALINNYLADETKLYQDWYTGLMPSQDSQYTKTVSAIPPLSELKKSLVGWLEQEGPSFKAKLCEQYSNKRQLLRSQESLLIAAIADSLTVVYAGVPNNSVALAVILVSEKHLDRICDVKID